METLFAALISGGLALIGTVLTVNASTKKTENTMKTELAVMRTEMSNLRKEVEKHNNFAERVPKLEVGLEHLKAESEQKFERLEGFHMH